MHLSLETFRVQDILLNVNLLPMGAKVIVKSFYFSTLSLALETLNIFIVFVYVGCRAVVQDQHALMR